MLHVFVDVVRTLVYLGVTELQDFVVAPDVAMLGTQFTVRLAALHAFGTFITMIFRMCWWHGLRSTLQRAGSYVSNTRATDGVFLFVSTTGTSLDARTLHPGNAWLHCHGEDGLVRHGDRSAAADANVSGYLEQHATLKGHPGITMIRVSTLQCHELTFDGRFDVGAIEVIGFCTVVDEKQDSKFMGAQHSRLQLVR